MTDHSKIENADGRPETIIGGSTMETFEEKFKSFPELNVGGIWNVRDRGVCVVVSKRAAEWDGEDIDVYAHIDTWYTFRHATQNEQQTWNRAVAANTARKALRKRFNVHPDWKFNGNQLCPPSAHTRRLDSYDDRWEPPQPIALAPDEIEIETEYAQARAALTGTA